MYRKCIELSFLFILTIQLMAWESIGCCDNTNNNNVRSRRHINRSALYKRQRLSKRQLMLAPALLLTTADSISLIYPKEMGYAKDFLHTIYKLEQSDARNETTNQKKHRLRIEDAVYDNRTWSIYFILSNASAAGSQIIRLTHLVPFYKQKIFNQKHLNNLKELDSPQKYYQIASNWIQTVVYSNSSAKQLSLDINIKNRKLYWFEFNFVHKKWSVGVQRLARLNLKRNRNISGVPAKYFTFEEYSARNMFANDGYTFISVAKDNTPNSLTDSNNVTVFITNNQTLNICFLDNLTCADYFRAPQLKQQSITGELNVETSISNEPLLIDKTKSMGADLSYETYEDFYYVDEDFSNDESSAVNEAKYGGLDMRLDSNKTANANQQTTTLPSLVTQPPIYKFGRLMGIKYDPIGHALYLADYGFDRIERITFRAEDSFEFNYIESIMKSEYGQQAPLNPLMTVFYESFIFWIDFEEGLKTTVFKSSCIRSIYKIKQATSLKLIQIGTFQQNKHRQQESQSKASDKVEKSIHDLNRLISLQEADSKFQYPPDYYFYNKPGSEYFERPLGEFKRSHASISAASIHIHSAMCLNLIICISFSRIF